MAKLARLSSVLSKNFNPFNEYLEHCFNDQLNKNITIISHIVDTVSYKGVNEINLSKIKKIISNRYSIGSVDDITIGNEFLQVGDLLYVGSRESIRKGLIDTFSVDAIDKLTVDFFHENMKKNLNFFLESKLLPQFQFSKNICESSNPVAVGIATIKNISGILDSSGKKKLDVLLEKEIKIAKGKYQRPKEVKSKSEYVKELRKIHQLNGFNSRKLNRYIPSNQQLLERVVNPDPKRGGIYRIHNVVDANNWGSIKYELSMGIYNLDNIIGDITLAFGEEGDTIKTMAKGNVDAKGFVLLKDNEGPFGSPVSDTERTKISENTKNALLVVYAPGNINKSYLLEATEKTASMIADCASAELCNIEVKYSYVQ